MKDKEKTKVMFLVHRDEDGQKDCFAYFPEEIFSQDNKMCYAHIGQHSGCCETYANESIHINPKDLNEFEWAADLKKELESIGYNLEVI